MSAPTDQFLEIATRTQDALTSAVRTWADTVTTFTGSVTGSRPALPDAQVAVDRYFDFAEQVLENQRRLARTAESVAARTVNVTETAVNKAADVTKAAGEQTAANARAAKVAGK
jgi:hypothetical protein